MSIVQKKIFLFMFVLVLCSGYIMNYLSDNIFLYVEKYGEYGCENLIVKLTNELISDVVNDGVKNELIKYDDEFKTLDFNAHALNSVAVTVVNKLLVYLEKMERGFLEESFLSENNLTNEYKNTKNGVVYLIPLSVIINNSLISSLGYRVPIRYKIIGKIEKNIISEIEEYGINNAFVKISLELYFYIQIVSPVFSENKKIKISTPLVIQIIQGDIPDMMYGSNIIGGR